LALFIVKERGKEGGKGGSKGTGIKERFKLFGREKNNCGREKENFAADP